MTLLDRIRTAPDDAQVSILYRAGTPGEMRGGEDIYSIDELRELLEVTRMRPVIKQATEAVLHGNVFREIVGDQSGRSIG